MATILGDGWKVPPYNVIKTASGLDQGYEIVKFKSDENGDIEVKDLTSQDCEKMLGYSSGYLSNASKMLCNPVLDLFLSLTHHCVLFSFKWIVWILN